MRAVPWRCAAADATQRGENRFLGGSPALSRFCTEHSDLPLKVICRWRSGVVVVVRPLSVLARGPSDGSTRTCNPCQSLKYTLPLPEVHPSLTHGSSVLHRVSGHWCKVFRDQHTPSPDGHPFPSPYQGRSGGRGLIQDLTLCPHQTHTHRTEQSESIRRTEQSHPKYILRLSSLSFPSTVGLNCNRCH